VSKLKAWYRASSLTSAKLLGVILKCNLSFDDHITTVLQCCSQRAYILKLLPDQGMSQIFRDNVFHALIMSKIQYVLCAMGWLFNTDPVKVINDLHRKMYKYNFTQ